MSKHVSRKQRWTRETPTRYVSLLGKVVYQQRAWYGLLEYRTLAPRQRESDLMTWDGHALQLGPFKRPRNAMVALEQEATILRNRHGDNVAIP